MRRSDFPIFEIEPQVREALRTHRRLVISAPTGSGKSTQVPQMLLDSGALGAGQVAILQPRRLPARLLAAWVARERGARLGGEVGYQMRFENVTSADTRICYATEGVLLRRMLGDPELRDVSAIIFDEFHERHLYGDITLALALEIQRKARPDLVVVVMSATLDGAAVEKYLEPCAVLSSAGRAYPVTIEYLRQPRAGAPVWELAVRELRRLADAHREGDALVFMPGRYEIARTITAARAALGGAFIVLPLHGELPPADQDAAVARYSKRKIVVATNVAETSLTIDGVRLVIDSGLARTPRYDPYRGINTLLVEKISRAAADQRAGRAGRTAPGYCLRLWTEEENRSRPAHELPEVKRLDLAEVALTLKAAGVNDLREFRWLEPPEARALARAESLLADLGAIDGTTGAITPLGRRMVAFPTHPRYARMLLAAHERGCVGPLALIAALTQTRDLLLRGERNRTEEALSELLGDETASDFFALMRAWRYAEQSHYDSARCRRIGIHAQAARQAGQLYEHFLRLAAAEGLDTRETPVQDEAVQRCVLVGFVDQLARRAEPGSARCTLVHQRRGVLSRESVVQAPLFVAAEAREIERGAGRERALEVVLSLATAVKEDWLRELFPEDLEEVRLVAYDPGLERVVVRNERRFRDLCLDESVSFNPPRDQAAAILAREVASGRIALDDWSQAVEPWLVRVSRLREWMPELELPAIGDQERRALLELICHGATSAKALRRKPALAVVKSWLGARQQAWVEQYAPERVRLPSGRSAKVVYSPDGPPTIAARIQDLYGVKDALSIAAGRVKARIQVLAPSNRPVQVTDDLSLFWRETYPKLKQELKRRYPKHEWR
ncbi:MAG TPA: ATP-dependent helicase HrpB [Candidatus Acidoferrales bacterium]|nr:ATP-dependent helicase HrpB [Candidatus Acidoferrales bacterium]